VNFFAGIDGGQSSTVAVIGDESGRVLARGTSGPADEVGEGRQSTRLRDALQGALANALEAAMLPAATKFGAIVAGVSGYEGRVYGQAPTLPTDRLRIVHDTEIAHAGALGGEPGIVVIAGTGSVAYARDDRGEEALVGGWGFLFGDEGGAFWIAREAIGAAMRAQDAGEACDYTTALLEHFGKPSLHALARAFYAGEISRSEIAAFAPTVMQLARAGNTPANEVVDKAAAALVRLAKHAAQQLAMHEPHVAFTGGLLREGAFSERIDLHLREVLPNARRLVPQRDPAEGALLLARRMQ